MLAIPFGCAWTTPRSPGDPTRPVRHDPSWPRGCIRPVAGQAVRPLRRGLLPIRHTGIVRRRLSGRRPWHRLACAPRPRRATCRVGTAGKRVWPAARRPGIIRRRRYRPDALSCPGPVLAARGARRRRSLCFTACEPRRSWLVSKTSGKPVSTSSWRLTTARLAITALSPSCWPVVWRPERGRRRSSAAGRPRCSPPWPSSFRLIASPATSRSKITWPAASVRVSVASPRYVKMMAHSTFDASASKVQLCPQNALTGQQWPTQSRPRRRRRSKPGNYAARFTINPATRP